MEHSNLIEHEISRICGWDNAYFGVSVNKDTNEVVWFVRSFVNGKSDIARFAKYADAMRHLNEIDNRIKGNNKGE